MMNNIYVYIFLQYIAYGIINMEFCGGPRIIHKSSDFEKTQFDKECPDCSETSEPPVCGIRQDGEGYRLRTFRNKCELTKHNCVKGTHFFVTEFYLCNDDKPAAYDNDVTQKEGPAKEAQTIEKLKKIKPLVIVSGSMIDKNNINESIDNFFASTHLVNMPLKQQFLNESTRKVFASILGPRVIFTPWTTKPKNVSTDYLHMPLVKTCFHKCPTKCPDTYAPVCGVPGANTNYPSVVFKNHCFMDVAQCKIVTEELSSSVHTAGYLECAFVFCLGDQLGQVYRLLPVLRTLQHLGRIKKKGRFKYKIRNLRFLSNFIKHPGNVNIMG